MFPSLPTLGNMTKHRQEAIFSQQCFLVCPGLNVAYSIPAVVWKSSNLLCVGIQSKSVRKKTGKNITFLHRRFYRCFLLLFCIIFILFISEYQKINPSRLCWKNTCIRRLQILSSSRGIVNASFSNDKDSKVKLLLVEISCSICGQSTALYRAGA